MLTSQAWLSGYGSAIQLIEMKLAKIEGDKSEAAVLVQKVLRDVLADLRKASPERTLR